MKKLDITPITNSSQFPVKKGTLQFLQDAHKETLAATIIALIGATYNPAVVYVLYGVINSGTLPLYNISQGAIFYGGEVYYVDAISFTPAGSNVGIFTIVQSQYTVDADPVTFTDTTVRNVHDIFKIQVAQGATGSGIADYSTAQFLTFVIPPRINLTQASTGPYVDNILQILGAYPDIQLYVPTPASSAHPILALGNTIIGDVLGGGTDVTIPFGLTLADTNYIMLGTLVGSTPPTAEDNTTVLWTLKTKTTTGCTIHLREYTSPVQNLSIDWIIFKK